MRGAAAAPERCDTFRDPITSGFGAPARIGIQLNSLHSTWIKT